MNAVTAFKPDPKYTALADKRTIERTKKALEANGFEVSVVNSAAEAKAKVLELVPPGSEVMTNTSKTLDDIGVSAEINESGRYDALRPKLMALFGDPTKKREQRKIASAPDFAVGSVHAVTEDGHLVIASGSGSQLGPYPYSAGKVILVAGTHKIVRDQEEANSRIHEHALPLEHERALAVYGQGSAVGKVLTLRADRNPGRTTVILIHEPLGF
jgi:acyl-CoA hydrolase